MKDNLPISNGIIAAANDWIFLKLETFAKETKPRLKITVNEDLKKQ
jgi:hypothetical protein